MTDFNPAWVLRAPLLGLLLFSGCSKTTEPAADDFSDRAAYVLIVRGDNALYTIRGDGTRPERIGEGYWPLVSPDGKLVAFRQSGGSSTLFVCDVSSRVTRQILSTENWDRYAWSPDGKMVFAGGHIVAWPSLELIEDFSGVTSEVYYCKWFPDSKHLFIRTSTDTYRFNIETKAYGWISGEKPNNGAFTVSSDGMLAGYIPSPGKHLTVMNSDGPRKTSITIPGVSSYTYMQFAGDTAW